MKKIISLLLFSIVTLNVFATTAFPEKVEFTQPNGEKVTIFMKGDEFIKYATTIDGFTLLYDSEGFFNYAMVNQEGNLVPSIFHAQDITKRTSAEIHFLQSISTGLYFSIEQINSFQYIRSITENQLSSINYNSRGSLKLLCILMGFPDKPFVKTNADFQNLFNQIGYNFGSAAGSVRDFYTEASYNQLNVIFDVVGPFTSANDMNYYGSNSYGDASQLAYEAIQYADPLVNFADYDNNNDGQVDGLYIIFAGNGEEAGAGADAIWSHAGGVYTNLDNVQISGYACSPEHRGASGNAITYIGVICHELGHVLGAPDYYDTNYETGGSYDGTGTWDLMASGSWNGSGRTPAHPNPRIKVYTYQWAQVETLTTAQVVAIPPSKDYSNAFYRINTSTNNEYFILENRTLNGFDIGNPGNGMMIYRCASNINSGSINTTHKQKFYPVAANSTQALPTTLSYGSIESPSCPWPGTLNKTSFTDATLPSMKSWANVNTNKPITNISLNNSNSIITFDFMGGGPSATYPVFSPNTNGATITPSNGSVSPVIAGGSYSFTLQIAASYSNSNVIVRVGADTLIPVNSIYTIPNINSPKVIELLNLNINQYPIIAYPSTNGAISPSDTTLVNYNSNISYAITPNVGYSVLEVFVDSVSVGVVSSYTFTNVMEPHSIYAHFQVGSPDIIQSSSNNLYFTTTQNVPSDYQVTTVTADISQLTINILVKAPQHFQVSLNGTTWYSQLVVQKSNLPEELYVRFSPTIIGQISDTIKISSYGAMSYLFVSGLSNVGVEDIRLDENDVMVYPNPTQNEIFIELSEQFQNFPDWEIEIYDILTHKLQEDKIQNSKMNIDVSKLPSGVYFIILSNKNNRIVKKFVIQ
ncbi:MAG TPA: M6 family metalloprotease domain-containing protein [Bacteroidales bacterium]|nr:M6 family metalloprotease domain-containing protein [Bacteroidales bacterium]